MRERANYAEPYDPRDRRGGWPFAVQDPDTIPGLTKAERRQYKKMIDDARKEILEEERHKSKIKRDSTLDIAAYALEIEMEDRAALGLTEPSPLQEPLNETDIDAVVGSLPFEETGVADEVVFSEVEIALRAAQARRRTQEEQLLNERRALVFR